MTTTKAQPKSKLTFEQYLDFCATTDARYELVRGELHLVNPPTLPHMRIAKFLERLFDAEIQRLGESWEVFREIGQRTKGDSSRLPDVTVARREDLETLPDDRSAILPTPSVLVVEIVSSSSSTEDYKEKLEEYQAKRIPEYWVVNALSKRDKRVTIYTLADEYQKQEFRGTQLLVSQTFPSLTLTAEQVLNAKI